MTYAPDLLERAAKTMRDRAEERDTEAERSMAKTVRLFNAQFGTQMSEYQGWMFMVFLKFARAEGGKFREDDYLDAAAYVALAGECLGNQPKPREDIVLSAIPGTLTNDQLVFLKLHGIKF